jgi:hypothetical protein
MQILLIILNIWKYHLILLTELIRILNKWKLIVMNLQTINVSYMNIILSVYRLILNKAVENNLSEEDMPTKKNEPTVPITAAMVACQNEIPKPKKNEPYDKAKKETFAAAHGQNKERALPARSDSLIKLILFNSSFFNLPN